MPLAMCRLLRWACVLLFWAPVSLYAQTTASAVANSVDVLVLPPGGSDPNTTAPVANGTRTTAIAQASPICNLFPPTGTNPAPLVNPVNVYFDDPFTPGRVCRVPLPVTLAPASGYRAVAVFSGVCTDTAGVTTACQSVRSPVASPAFDVRNVVTRPTAPTNVLVRP